MLGWCETIELKHYTRNASFQKIFWMQEVLRKMLLFQETLWCERIMKYSFQAHFQEILTFCDLHLWGTPLALLELEPTILRSQFSLHQLLHCGAATKLIKLKVQCIRLSCSRIWLIGNIAALHTVAVKYERIQVFLLFVHHEWWGPWQTLIN